MKMRNPFSILRNQVGISLMELFIGMAITGVIIVAGVKVMNMAGETEDRSYVQALIDSHHLSGVQTARSLNQVRRFIMAVDAAGIPDPNGALYKCFAKKGTGCTALQTAFQPLVDKQGDLNARFGKKLGKCTATDRTCFVKREAQFKLLCSQEKSCEWIEINVATTYDGVASENTKYYKREGTFRIPGAAMVARGEIDFACAGTDRLVVSIDYEKLMATCAPVTGFNGTVDGLNPAVIPITSFAGSPAISLQNVVNSPACNDFGVNNVGLFANEHVCAPCCDPP